MPSNRFSHFRFLLTLLALPWFLSACNSENADSDQTKLYVLEANEAELNTAPGTNTYQLKTAQHQDPMVWFHDRPGRDTGTENLLRFTQQTWPKYFKPYPPNIGLAYRDANGDWFIAPAKVLSLEANALSTQLTWTLQTDSMLESGVLQQAILYLDNEGGLLKADQSHTFLQAAARGQLQSTASGYRLSLSYPLDEILMLPVTPNNDFSVITTDFWVNDIWPKNFQTTPPNASVTLQTDDNRLHTLLVTLSNPQWDADRQTLTYGAEILRGNVPETAGTVLVYIDTYFDEDKRDTRTYKVLVNREAQYSIWLADRESPIGWQDAGFQGSKVECLDYIDDVWTDMRPLSLRKKMDEMERNSGSDW